MAPSEYPLSPLRPGGLEDVKVHVDTTATASGTPKSVGSPFARGISLLKLAGNAKGDSSVLQKLESLDKDGDGRLSVEELQQAVVKLVKEEDRHKQYKTLACVVTGVLLFVLLANMGLAYAVAVLAKETNVVGDVMYSKETGRPVQVEDSQFLIRDGSMVARSNQEQVVETALATEWDNLTALYSDEYFGQLKTLHLSSSDGASAQFAVLGFVRTPDNGVNFLTSAGTILMGADDSFHVDTQVSQFLEASGFDTGVPTVGSNTTSEVGPAGRRLLFNFARNCNTNARGNQDRVCYTVAGEFGFTRRVTCKYGDARGGRDGEHCTAFCRGFTDFTWETALCFNTYDLSNDAFEVPFPCNNELQCQRTSRGCAPSENSYCCCYDATGRADPPGGIDNSRDQPGSPSYG